MGYRLRRHPFEVSAHFRHSLVLAYALPASALEPLLPATLEPDRHGDLGFVVAAFVQTERMRPSFLPAALGLDFFLGGYRIFVRVAGRPSLRGLHIIRSDTDRRLLTFFGNALTSYRYRTVDATCRCENGVARGRGSAGRRHLGGSESNTRSTAAGVAVRRRRRGSTLRRAAPVYLPSRARDGQAA